MRSELTLFRKSNLSIMSIISTIFITSLIFSGPSIPFAQAAEGDVVQTIECFASGSSVGIGFDGDAVWWPDGFSANVLKRCDLDGNALPNVSVSGLDHGLLSSISYDVTRDLFWGISGSSNPHAIYQIQKDGTAVYQYSVNAPGISLIDGFAYDGEDDTLWVSPDVSGTIYHFKVSDGSFINSFPVPQAPGNSCGNSGVATGTGILYLGFNGCNYIQKHNKNDLSLISSFQLNGADRVEDLECGLTKQGQEVIWSKDAYEPLLIAFEVPDGTCPVGGVIVEPKPNPITEVHCDVEEAETSIELLYESEDLTGLTFETDALCAIHRGNGEPELKDAIINVTKNVPDFEIPENTDVNLFDWTAESFGGNNWAVQEGGTTVIQTVNGDPTFFYAPFNAFNTEFTGVISMANDGDNDYVGFVLGFNPDDTNNLNADYLLVDWKMGDQPYGCGTAIEGLAVSRVQGIPDINEFWNHSDCNEGNNGSLTELARGNNLGSTGWQYNTPYEFSFVFTANNLKVYVNGDLEIDIDGEFSDGRVGFYNYSQSQVTYSGFNVVPVFDETGTFTINFLDESDPIVISEEGSIIADPDGPTFGIDGKITGSDIIPQCGEVSFIVTALDGLEYSMVDIGSIWLMACPVDEQIKKSGGDNQWDKRPTFGVNHEDRETQIVENGFRFNNEQFTITDNYWTPFEEREVEIGTTNTFAATVYADKGLWIQEFLFGIPKVGEGHLAELNVEVWYDRDGNIDDVKLVQKTDVVDPDTITVSHEKTKCLATDPEPICDTTTVSMTFLEPLKDKVMAIGAIDWERRNERTNLNEGFDISGDSLNPMQSKMIPSNVKNAGLLEVTQVAKYSPYWKSDNGRIFEMNEFGSFTEINQKFERFQDSGNAFTRLHSGFGAIVEYEKNRAAEVFDASILISELPDSFGHHIVMKERMSEEMKQHMQLQEQIAKGILDQMDKQNRYY